MFNIMDIIVIVLILVSAFFGYKKGFMKSAINLVSFFVAIGLALMFYKPLAIILTENTQIDDWVIEKIISSEKEELEESENQKKTQEIMEENNSNMNTENTLEENGIGKLLNDLPTTILEKFNLEEIKENTKEEIAYQVSELIMNLLSLIIIYIIVKITLSIAVFVLDGIMKFPVLKQLNEILGLAFGGIIGILQIYVAFAIITFISSICDISFVIESIKISAFARILFENNLVIHLLF